jgi:error-prone DNA polymerase
MTSRYAELQVTSHFSFLRGASSCEELFAHAASLGIEALAVADRNTLAGIVRAHEAAKVTGVRLIVGCRLDLADGMSVLVYPLTGRRILGFAACYPSARNAAARPNAS